MKLSYTSSFIYKVFKNKHSLNVGILAINIVSSYTIVAFLLHVKIFHELSTSGIIKISIFKKKQDILVNGFREIELLGLTQYIQTNCSI